MTRDVSLAGARRSWCSGGGRDRHVAQRTTNSGDPITLHLAARPEHADAAADGRPQHRRQHRVLDVVYDGLVRYDPETTEPYNYVAESIDTTDNRCGRSRSSRT